MVDEPPGHAGVEEHGVGSRGFPGNLGDPAVSKTRRQEIPPTNSRLSTPRPGPVGQTTDATMVPPSEGNQVRREDGRESQQLIVPLKEEPTGGTRGGKELPSHEPMRETRQIESLPVSTQRQGIAPVAATMT